MPFVLLLFNIVIFRKISHVYAAIYIHIRVRGRMSVSMHYASMVLYVTAVLCLPVVCGTPILSFPQAGETLLRVGGETARPLTLSHAECAQLPHTVGYSR